MNPPGQFPGRGKNAFARMTGIAWMDLVGRPQYKTVAKARHERYSEVVPAVHRITAGTTILLYTKDRSGPIPETVDQ
jgi:hypothetical protein